MKTKKIIFAAAMLICTLSCDNLSLQENTGSICIHFTESSLAGKKSGAEIPDTNDFILTVTDSDGKTIFNGKYGTAPETISVAEGTYTIRAVSREFREPSFDAPQYGDERIVVVNKGGNASVLLDCKQTNCGIRLQPDYDFLSEFPKGELYLSAAEGMLMYAYNEKRTAFFIPGAIAVKLKDKGQVRTLLTRQMNAQEMLDLKLSAVNGAGGEREDGIRVTVDTSRIWENDEYVVGGRDSGSPEGAYSISEAAGHIGEKGVWIYGYIVGGDLTSSKCSFSAPFTSRTNLAIAAKSNILERERCIAVQLSKGDVRDAVNLVDHPENLGRQVIFKGEITESYFGLTGITSVTDYEWK